MTRNRAAALSATAVIFASLASPVGAQSGTDVKCLLASSLYAKAAKDPKVRSAAEASKLYYLGRIHGRMTIAKLKAEMVEQQKAINPKNAASIMNVCARQMEAGMKLVQSVGQQLAPKK